MPDFNQAPQLLIVHYGRVAWWITFAFVLFFYSYIPVHGFLYGGWTIRPVAIFVVAALALLPSLYFRGGLDFLSSPVALWCFLFLASSLAWFLLFGGDSVGPLLQRTYAIVVLLFSFGLMSVHPAAVHSSRVAIMCAVVLAALCNAVEVWNPIAFLPAGQFYGRAAGFYANPNLSGAALVLGMIISIGIIPAKWKWTFLAVSLGGVILTLSRAAILGWIIAAGLMVAVRVINVRTVLFSIALISVVTLVAWQFVLQPRLERAGIDEAMLLERVAWFVERNAIPDASQLEREHVAESAWSLIGAHPLLGNGLGATEDWSDTASTHNTYLYFMADYGVAGGVLFPLLILACIWQASGKVRALALIFGAYVAFWGLFSHNIVGEYYGLLSFAAVAALSRWSSFRRGSAADPTG